MDADRTRMTETPPEEPRRQSMLDRFNPGWAALVIADLFVSEYPKIGNRTLWSRLRTRRSGASR